MTSIITQVKSLDQLNFKDKQILLKQLQFGTNSVKVIGLQTFDNAENVLHLGKWYSFDFDNSCKG